MMVEEELEAVKKKVLQRLVETSFYGRKRSYDLSATVNLTHQKDQLFFAILDVHCSMENYFGKQQFAVLVQIDESKDPDDDERVGTIVFKGPMQEILGVYDDLESWMDGHWLPKFNSRGREISFYEYSQLVPRSELPRIDQLHRYKNHDLFFHTKCHGGYWWRFKNERRKWFWDMDMPDEGLKIFFQDVKVGPPSDEPKDPSKQAVPVRNHTDKVFNVLLECQNDDGSFLSWLPLEILMKIYEELVTFWSRHIGNRNGGVYASVVGEVTKWPKYTGICCNMMPFIMGQSKTIPSSMQQYLPILAACPVSANEFDEVCYLTIHESVITEDNQSQRRGGVHTETPGQIWLDSTNDLSSKETNIKGKWTLQEEATRPTTVYWGCGCHDGKQYYNYEGGIFMASNVANSTRVWNCQIEEPEVAVGPLGDLEHLRCALGKGETLGQGEIVWITDTTPHESLPLKAGTRRQYFRLVTSKVSVWYEEHSTPNPLGIEPPDSVKIIKGNKFKQVPLQEAEL